METNGGPQAANDGDTPVASAERVRPFPALVVDQAEIAFDHLSEFDFSFEGLSGQTVYCFVKFTTHCFSDRYDAARHPANVVVVDEHGVHRCFDADRYELSKGLKALIAGLPGNKVHQTPEANFAIITMQGGREYRVFFRIKKIGKNKVRLYVESAYAADPARYKVVPASVYQKVRFLLLVQKVLKGEALTFKGR